MKKLQIAILISLLLLGTIPLGVHASQLNIHIDGPTIIGTNQTVQYKVYVEGYFPLYRCGILISGYNLTGAKPLNQYVTSSKDGYFVFNVTAPNLPQTIYLNFVAYGMINNTKIGATTSRVLAVQVKRAMDVNVKIKNPENYDLYNTMLSFYLDGRYIGNTTVKVIKANSTKDVTYKWIPHGLYSGEHVLTVKISNNGVVFANGQKTYEYRFYYGTPPSYEYITYLSWGLLILVIVLFTLFFLGRQGKKSGPAPKWKK
ncbi:CARDB domain-containing protein [Aciduliprofundum sp. MAR08-339]|uniref:CARDB domain-containing protein n=1 Tax=Aciduliprofundum sp. (strain MAR08-339) TaxID=673860 RepID=UPI0002A4A00E|nr:CARDB domain-containing protein [Aciduliprofundum sp. MAR08-339]